MKGWATLITAISALIVAVGKAVQKPQEPAAKATYNELAKAVKETSVSTQRNHDDLIALRFYMLAKVGEPFEHDEDGIPDKEDEVAEHPRAGGKLAIPKVGAGGGGTTANYTAAPTITFEILDAGVPDLGPRPKVYDPPSFSVLAK